MRWALLGTVVVTTVLADLLQSHEMKLAGHQAADGRGLLRLLAIVIRRRNLILAIGLMAISFFAFLILVQTEPLSFAVPASAASFILETLLAKLVLKEPVGKLRTAGSVFIFGGILLVAR
jgi:drug/metabolite transporter (DMT)-like permease